MLTNAGIYPTSKARNVCEQEVHQPQDQRSFPGIPEESEIMEICCRKVQISINISSCTTGTVLIYFFQGMGGGGGGYVHLSSNKIENFLKLSKFGISYTVVLLISKYD